MERKKHPKFVTFYLSRKIPRRVKPCIGNVPKLGEGFQIVRPLNAMC